MNAIGVDCCTAQYEYGMFYNLHYDFFVSKVSPYTTRHDTNDIVFQKLLVW